ncbi:MAG: hypothetical protein ATN32_06855 [Candidatus Epulonipiscium fishelsonii]|nr:MAG: hypothetical protein ATN32_06855 [Epulopiscium sp. AS2M-Bin002]
MYFGYKNIYITFGKKEVLKDVTISFEKNKISTIIGQNGCGKSSLLRIISNAVKPISGEIIFENKSIKKYSRKDIAKKIAILPQVHNAHSDITVETLVSYGRYPHKQRSIVINKKDEEIISQSLNFMGLTNLRKQSLGTLSGGQRQRAWIAMTLSQQPEILILDEPTTHLDITYQIEILSLIETLNKNLGLTVIMVLHDLNQAARYSHKMYVIHDKNIFAIGTPREILTKNIMEEVFSLKTSIHEDNYAKSPYFLAKYNLKK